MAADELADRKTLLLNVRNGWKADISLSSPSVSALCLADVLRPSHSRAPGGAMASIFLSYSREDGAKAKSLAEALKKVGHEVWWDRHIQGGSEFSGEIEAALNKAQVVLVMWSRASVGSEWVRDEASEGRDSGRLLPVALDDSKAPLGFRQRQSIDMSGWSGSVQDRVAAAAG